MPVKPNTTKLQVSGWKWSIRRMERAFVLGTTSSQQTFLTSHKNSMFAAGTALIGVLSLIGLMLSFFRPSPSNGISEMMTTQDGGMFVSFEGRLHPVTNLASARLITGKPEKSQVVSNDVLKDFPPGPAMGIIGAPNNLTPRLDDQAQWVVCDWRDYGAKLSLLTSKELHTTILAGTDVLDGGSPLGKERAILARSEGDPSILWLLYGNHKAQVGARDFATLAALGITPSRVKSAATLSTGLMNSIDTLPILTTPPIEHRGQVSRVVPNALVGDVLVTTGSDGRRVYYAAMDGGAQLINSVIAQMLVNTGAAEISIPDSGDIYELPHVDSIDIERFPSQIPDLINPTTVCFKWSKGINDLTAETAILTSTALPVSENNAPFIAPLREPSGSVLQADASLMTPGKGWYVRVTGDDPNSLSEEQLFFISDNGQRFPIAPGEVTSGQGISYDNTVKALGLNIRDPLQIPWSIAQLYAVGPTLDPQDARVEHGQIALNLDQTAIAPKAGPPPSEVPLEADEGP